MTSEAYVGIDVAFAKNKTLPVAILKKENLSIKPLELRSMGQRPPRGKGNRLALDERVVEVFAGEVADWLKKIASEQKLYIKCIAIDAPSDFKKEGLKRRLAEQAMDARNISCLATPSKVEFTAKIDEARRHLNSGGKVVRMPNANQFWMLIGFQLFKVLRKENYDCIEVFPQAIAKEIGCSGPHKSTDEGFHEQVKKFAPYLDLKATDLYRKEMSYGNRHDRLDALMSAWIASLPKMKRIACGSEENDDVIWIPNVSEISKNTGSQKQS